MRVRVETADACKYPDIVALCEEPQFYDDRSGLDHNSGHPSNQPRYLTRNRLIAQALHRLILQLRLVLAGFMIKADRSDVLMNPILVIEILSPSTEAYDRGGKFAIYRALPSLQEYVLVAQDRLSVEVFTRQPVNRWLLAAYSTPEDEVVFDSIQCRIPLREIYDKVRIATPDVQDGEASV
jgi:hypothetical protein